MSKAGWRKAGSQLGVARWHAMVARHPDHHTVLHRTNLLKFVLGQTRPGCFQESAQGPEIGNRSDGYKNEACAENAAAVQSKIGKFIFKNVFT